MERLRGIRAFNSLNERGVAPAFLLTILAMVVILPAWFVSVNHGNIKNQLDAQERTQARDEVDNYVAAVFGSLPGLHSCTTNLKAMNLLNQPVARLSNIDFRPRLVEDNDANDAQDGEITNIDALNHIKDEFMEGMRVTTSVLKPCDRLDPMCPRVSNTGTVVYKWELTFEPDDGDGSASQQQQVVTAGVTTGTGSRWSYRRRSRGSYRRPAQTAGQTITNSSEGGNSSSVIRAFKRTILVNVGLDTTNKVLGCSLTTRGNNMLMEDKICEVIGAGDGATGHEGGATDYQIEPSTALTVAETCK